MQRLLEPELLDSLPPDHPDALHNRRDLRLTNTITGGHRWIAREVPGLMRPGERAIEIGAGTGELGIRLAKAGVLADGLDFWPRPAGWPAAANWHVGDARTFPGFAAYPVVLANLILHQFSTEELGQLGLTLRKTARVIVASEPVRRRFSQLLFRAFGPLLRANRVTLHDAHVSIAAGFRGDELPRALSLPAEDWAIRLRTSALGLYRMIAVRRE